MSTNPTQTAAATDVQENGREVPSNFIRDIIDRDLEEGRHADVVTRFPPEPNGYLHIGHAKSICLNFGIAEDYAAQVPTRCHLRFDDTNPTTEDPEYVESIKETVQWLGFDWDGHLYHASDYFEQLYAYAEGLIQDGHAYVDSLNEEEIRAYRGTVTEPGRPSPYRERSVEENLDLFRRMRAGAFEDGAHVLRAKIDLASPNMKMRDPLLYRIRHAHHYRTGDAWPIYPMYDFAHPLSDAIESVTHSICTLEFDNNRELYDWVLDHTRQPPRPHQYEFARLNLDYTVMSKRKLLELVEGDFVDGWDDPRLPTLAGMKQRGVTPESIRAFCERIGVAKANSRVDIGLLEYSLRDDLNFRAPRVMGVLRPLKVIITNWPEGETEWLEADYWPRDVPKEDTRKVPFGRTLYIDRSDFMEKPSKKFYRLAPGQDVRLRHAYIITCDEVIKDENGEVVELRCTYDPETKSGSSSSSRKVKGTIHWVEAEHTLPAEVRLYDRLFTVANPDEAPEDFKHYLNPESVVVLEDALVEPSVADDSSDTRYQFEREGYFWQDPVDSQPDALVFNRIVSLRDTWAKISGETQAAQAPAKPEAPKPKRTSEPPKEERDPVEALSPEAQERFLYYTRDLDLQIDDALILADQPDVAAFFEDAVEAHDHPQAIANWIVNELLREIKDTPIEALPFGGRHLGQLVALIDDGTLSSRTAKDVFAEMIETGRDPQVIAEEKGLNQISDKDTLASIADETLAAFPEKVAQYQAGKTGLIGFFVGQVMRQTQGRANPELVQELLRSKLP